MRRAALLWLVPGAIFHCLSGAGSGNAADAYPVNQRELQDVVDAATSNSVVRCDPNQPLILSRPLTIRKPLTLVGLRARLPEKLGNSLTDYLVTGNLATVQDRIQGQRAVVTNNLP